jgi:hydrogenase maturation protein HypF
VKQGMPVSAISTKFHWTVARIIVNMCRAASRDTGIKVVALSGGVFQNRLLFRLAVDGLHEEGFEVLTHRLVPCNDGGISLGQAAIANFAAT